MKIALDLFNASIPRNPPPGKCTMFAGIIYAAEPSRELNLQSDEWIATVVKNKHPESEENKPSPAEGEIITKTYESQ